MRKTDQAKKKITVLQLASQSQIPDSEETVTEVFSAASLTDQLIDPNDDPKDDPTVDQNSPSRQVQESTIQS